MPDSTTPAPDAASIGDLLRRHIRTVPNWPAPGVQFRDITPLLTRRCSRR